MEGDTQAFYRAPLTFRTILSGKTPAPEEAESFLKTVEKYAPTPRAHVAVTAAAPADTAPQPAHSEHGSRHSSFGNDGIRSQCSSHGGFRCEHDRRLGRQRNSSCKLD